MAKNFNVTGGLGFQGYNLKDHMGKSRAETGRDTTAATRDQFYGGAPTKNIPRSYVPSRIKQIFDPTPFATPVVKMPAAKTKKAVAKPAPQVVSNVTNAKMSPVKNSSVSKKPPATRFGTVTGKTTGTTVSGGGGYGGGGTRGGGSLSGQGSGSRTAGTSRTGGTKQNNPVRG